MSAEPGAYGQGKGMQNKGVGEKMVATCLGSVRVSARPLNALLRMLEIGSQV